MSFDAMERLVAWALMPVYGLLVAQLPADPEYAVQVRVTKDHRVDVAVDNAVSCTLGGEKRDGPRLLKLLVDRHPIQGTALEVRELAHVLVVDPPLHREWHLDRPDGLVEVRYGPAACLVTWDWPRLFSDLAARRAEPPGDSPERTYDLLLLHSLLRGNPQARKAYKIELHRAERAEAISVAADELLANTPWEDQNPVLQPHFFWSGPRDEAPRVPDDFAGPPPWARIRDRLTYVLRRERTGLPKEFSEAAHTESGYTMSDKTGQPSLGDVERRARDVARLSEEPDDFFEDRSPMSALDCVLLRQTVCALKDGDLFWAHHFDGRSQAELAKDRGISQQALSKRLARVRGKLAEILPDGRPRRFLS